MCAAASRFVVGSALLCLAATGCRTEPPPAWTEDRPLRRLIEIDGITWSRGGQPIVLALDRGPGNPDSIRLSELDASGNVVEAEVPFQFDPVPDPTRGGDELTVLVGGSEEHGPRRRFALYFDDAGRYTPGPTGQWVEATPGIRYRGAATVRVKTGYSTWFYHEDGAGFAGLHIGGADWLGYRPGGGAGGEYRGLPNLVYPEGYFHPGGTECSTELVATGPLRAVLDSECGDGAWATRWEIFRLHARLTVLRAAHPYWFLYEGTPGGSLEEDRDYYVLSDGSRFLAGEPRDGDLPDPEWLYFGDPSANSVLWLAHERDDAHPDAYYPMDGLMTVFGFGRERTRSFLTETPRRFLVGFARADDHERVAGAVETALALPAFEIGAVERRPAD